MGTAINWNKVKNRKLQKGLREDIRVKKLLNRKLATEKQINFCKLNNLEMPPCCTRFQAYNIIQKYIQNS